MEQKKPWYKSKIVLLAVAGIFTIGSDIATGWLSGQGVTPEQLEAVRATHPAVADAIEQFKTGEGLLKGISIITFAAIGLFRKWFTNALLS